MSTHQKAFYSPEEYLSLERTAEYKSEYFNGEIFALAGATPEHVLIVTNVVSELREQLKKSPCTVYSTDLRLKVSPTGLYTYPDVVVVCEEPRYDDEQKDTLLNPILIIEILSESTRDYDRGDKFEQYRTIDTFSEYILIAQDKYHVEHFVKQPEHTWLLSETNRREESVSLKSIPCVLALKEIYDKVRIAK